MMGKIVGVLDLTGDYEADWLRSERLEQRARRGDVRAQAELAELKKNEKQWTEDQLQALIDSGDEENLEEGKITPAYGEEKKEG